MKLQIKSKNGEWITLKEFDINVSKCTTSGSFFGSAFLGDIFDYPKTPQNCVCHWDEEEEVCFFIHKGSDYTIQYPPPGDYTFTGAIDNEWNNPKNWLPSYDLSPTYAGLAGGGPYNLISEADVKRITTQ
jgi:hypothetical protein